MNPLLDFACLPRFAEITPAHVTPAVSELIDENRSIIQQLLSDSISPSWNSFVAPLEDANERLSRAWGQVSHLNAVMNSPELRQVYNANLPKITHYYAELAQNRGLFEKYKRLKTSAEYDQLTPAQRKVIDNELRDFRLGGAELPADKKARFLEIQEELASLAAKFQENLLDATNAETFYLDVASEVAGIPSDALAAANEAAKKEGKSGWMFTLHAPSYVPVMQYADNRTLREKMYRAYVSRAAEFGKAEWDNTELMNRILRLRAEEAQLLEYESFAHLSLVAKMAKSPAEVLSFLYDLAQKAKPFAERDMAELRAFARSELSLKDLKPWDVRYVAEKLRGRRFAFSQQQVKHYFPEPQVLAGMFRVVQSVFGIFCERSEAPVWHPDVKFFRIRDRAGDLVGQFYLDLYARETKRSGAWMDDAITRRRKGSSVQTPVAYLTCNFSAPIGGNSAFFTHEEVITLFHEFGHALHHLLTQVDELSVAGINGVEWDAVELPSQFMENFCWEWDVLRQMTKYVDTGQPLPLELFEKMRTAKNFLSGMDMVRQLEFALFDMQLHCDYRVDSAVRPRDVLNQIREQVAVIIPPGYDRFPNSFSHIFAGG